MECIILPLLSALLVRHGHSHGWHGERKLPEYVSR
jgi:hypothetical protein